MADKGTDTTHSARRADRDSARSQEIGRLPAPPPLTPRDAPEPPPRPPARNLDHFQFEKDDKLKPWLKDEQDKKPAKPAGDLDENEMSFVVRARARRLAKLAGKAGMDLNEAVHKAMEKYTPKLAQPAAVEGSLAANLHHVFSQPEMIAFWEGWMSQPGERGPQRMDAGVKAVLMTLAMGGGSQHLLRAHERLCDSESLRKIFGGVELAATLRAHDAGETVGYEDFLVPGYKGTAKRVSDLTRLDVLRPIMLETSAQMFREIWEHTEGAGRRLLIDGHIFRGWVPQVGKGKTAAQEFEIRRHCPDAGARLYVHGKGGKRSVGYGEKVGAGEFALFGKFVRGFNLVTIIDQATGYPLISTVMDASIDEVAAMRPLLEELFHYYDYLDPEVLVGDKAYDETELHRVCKLNFGIDLIARPSEVGRPKNGKDAKLPAAALNGGVAGITHEGRLRCAEHDKLVDFADFEQPSREGLLPGEAIPGNLTGKDAADALKARESKFRVRAWHRHELGAARRLSILARFDWRRLNRYPRYPEGNVMRFAERLVLGMRRMNQGEGYFSVLQASLGVATGEGARLRLRDMETVAAVIGGAEMRYRALKVAGFRAQRGESPPPLPDAPVGPPPVAGQGGSKAHRRRSSGGPGSGAGGSSPVDPVSEQSVVSAESTTVTETAPGTAATPGRFRRRDGSRPARRLGPSRRPWRRRRGR